MQNIIIKVSDLTFKRLKAQKATDGFENQDFGAWLAWKSKNVDLSGEKDAGRRTVKYLLGMWCRNFAANMPQILKGKSISVLVPEFAEQVDNFQHLPLGQAIVIGAGPSVYKHKHLQILADAIQEGKYKGIVCVSDRMLKPCLELGIKPYIAVSVDGSPLIAKWYTDLNEYDLTGIHACLNVTSHPSVVEACNKSGLEINWFNPMMDSEDANDTFTRLEKLMTVTDDKPNGVPAISCGGNAGAATWVLTQTLLRRAPIALIGMDLGYPEGTKLEDTPYYSAYMQNAKGDVGIIGAVYRKIYHPAFKTTAYIDEVFSSYRNTFLSLLKKSPPWSYTINCTEGGTLYGPRLDCMSFTEFISKDLKMKAME